MSKIFDAALALEHAGGSEKLARDLFGMLLDELADHRRTIEAAFKQVNSQEGDGTLEPLMDPVHRLHGATLYLGVPALSQAVKTFGSQIRQNNRARLRENFRHLDSEISRLQKNSRGILTHSW